MFSKFFLKSKNKDLAFLIIQIHLLVFILVGVLWSMSRLNQGSPSFLTMLFSGKNHSQIQAKDQKRSATIVSPDKKKPSTIHNIDFQNPPKK